MTDPLEPHAGGFYLFVYGTLMRGHPGHVWLAGARFVRVCRTQPCYTLLSMGAWPGLLSFGHQQVTGELYRCRRALLPALDAYEEYPALYTRSRVRLCGAQPVAWTYLLRERGPYRALPKGVWRAWERGR